MLSREKIGEYISAVCSQIRWKRAHGRVSEEMTNHIIDSRDALIAQGMDEQEATEKAIAETGDAVSLGTQLDRIHRPKPQWGMLGAVAVLLLIGILIRLFIFTDEDRVGLLETRLLFAGLGVAGMFAAYFADFTLFGRFPKVAYFSCAAIFIVLLQLSPRVAGRYVYAHTATLLFPLAFAGIVFAMRNKRYWGIIVCGIANAGSFLLMYLAPSLIGIINMSVCSTAIMLAAIMKNWFGIKKLPSIMLVISPVVAAVIFLFSYGGVRRRLSVAVNPYTDPLGEGYWAIMVRDFIKGAVWFGQGDIPEQYWSSATEPSIYFYTELTLTALIALVGWFAFALVISVFLFFIIKGFVKCFKQKSTLGLFISLSVMMILTLQTVEYVVYNLGFVFASPISLPLVSFGNIATIINLVLIGFMLSVFRAGDAVTDGKPAAAGAMPQFPPQPPPTT